MHYSGDDEGAQEHMQLHRCGSKQLERSYHQNDERDVLGKVGMRAYRRAQGGIIAVAKADAISAAQLNDAHAQDGVNEPEHPEIRGTDDRSVHVSSLRLPSASSTRTDPTDPH
jgi:hypothetical protein